MNSHTTPDGFMTDADTELMGRIAQAINEQAPELSAIVWHSGGGIFGILLQLPDGQEAFFGTADTVWSADVQDADGESIDSITSEVRCDDSDAARVASAMIRLVRAYVQNS